ncbi:glycoside hydrolase family 3 C-terminal domain-containing protein [Paenibacillus sp. TRM 82003]|nr:glycoside hydrolase family 3 C-terminal domain-containing protein [Paenibacillus sp. TRM 82003]
MSESVRFPFQNPALPLEARVVDLVSRLTLDEKINQMCQYQDEIPRLGIKPYKHGTEAAHGIAWLGKATTYPQPIGLAGTWDADLLRRVGSAIGDEARGFYRRDPAVNGLTLWAPTVDMERDPRWGRTEEAYGEDPELTGELATALIHGLQGDHPFYVKAVASLKHFLGNNNEIDRGTCSVSLDPRNLREYYLKAFEKPFKEGGALSMMTAYNAVNGVPANVNPDVVDLVKREWGMNGFVVSDAGDVTGTVDDHRYYETYKESVAASIRCGIDSITDDHPRFKEAMREAVAEGLLTENDLDVALRNTFRVRMRLGEFDPAENNPYASIDESVIMRPEHEALALEAARKGVVLLKNDDLLPLDASKLANAAVIGPLGGIVYRDWYSGELPYAVTPLDGVRRKLEGKNVAYQGATNRIALKSSANGRYVRLDDAGRLTADVEAADAASVFEITDWGWDSHTLIAEQNGKYVTTNDTDVLATSEHIWEWFTKEVFHLRHADDGKATLTTWNDRPVGVNAETGALAVSDGLPTGGERFEIVVLTDGLREAVSAAAAAETAIVFVGNHPLINGKETIDRPDLTLPASQERLIQEVYRANPNTVVVVVGSYPYALNWADANIPSIVYTTHAGQELGNAVADVLFGDYNPAGRLSMTWYKSVEQLPDFMDYDIIKGNRTYQYFEGEPLYAFGHGLSYARFEYEALRTELVGDAAMIRFRVRNVGGVDGEEVAQLYVRAERSRVKRPRKQLKRFRRFALAAGQSTELEFTLPLVELAFWDVTRERFCVEAGTYGVMVGASSADIRLTGTIEAPGEVVPPRDLAAVTKAINYDDYENVIMEEGEQGGTAASLRGDGAWLRYDDAAFPRGANAFEARIASLSAGTLELRLGSTDGELVGTAVIPAGSGARDWRTVACSVEGLPLGAVASICLVLRSEEPARVSWFRFFG